MLQMSWDKLSKRARTLLQRIAVFQQAIPLAALKWVMGTEVAMSSEQLALYREQVRSNKQNAEAIFLYDRGCSVGIETGINISINRKIFLYPHA